MSLAKSFTVSLYLSYGILIHEMRKHLQIIANYCQKFLNYIVYKTKMNLK